MKRTWGPTTWPGTVKVAKMQEKLLTSAGGEQGEGTNKNKPVWNVIVPLTALHANFKN